MATRWRNTWIQGSVCIKEREIHLRFVPLVWRLEGAYIPHRHAWIHVGPFVIILGLLYP